MNNFDDIFAPKPSDQSADSASSDSRKEWVARKQQERKDVYSLIDTTTERMAANGDVFQSYLDVQSRFDRYSVKNAILVTAQNPSATKLASFDEWSANGVSVNKGEKGLSILVPDKEYPRRDGSKGTNFIIGKVFDISQTSAVDMRQTVSHDPRKLLEALVRSSPCPIETRNDAQAEHAARFDPQSRKIYVRQGMDAPTLFRSISQEIAVAHFAQGRVQRNSCEFDAYCISYILCKRFNVPVSTYSFEKMPERLSRMEPKDIQAELKRIRETSGKVSDSIKQSLESRQKNPKSHDDNAR